ncbi:MAG: hypothetical protein OXF50_02970 [Caldilineaceae bacterium]|nr:hypothetical protein [Caldilineaceae bacterium]
MATYQSSGKTPIDIGSRLELMIDDYLIARLSGGAVRRLNRPTPREVVLVTDMPWEGNTCLYFTVFQDGPIYRMYYRGSHYVTTATTQEVPHPAAVCYAESADGIHWTKPNLGLVEFNGSVQNNIILDKQESRFPVSEFAPFKDANPNAAPDAKYKAWTVRYDPRGLHPLSSPDGIHWTPMSDEAVITHGLFDSHNLAFWDTLRGEYRDYHRSLYHETGAQPYSAKSVGGRNADTPRGSRYGRDVLTATSQDFIHWTDPVYINYTEGRTDELYINGIIPYSRAPHIFLGFPARYIDRGWSDAIEDLPELAHRRRRANAKSENDTSERRGSALTDSMFMTSRDGQTFKLWPESFIRPGLRPRDNWAYGDNYPNWGLVTTKSAIDGAPDEISLYLTEGYWRGESLNLRRYTLRIDGFVSVQAPLSGGEVVTKALIFAGRQLILNFSASAAGSIRVEILRDQMDAPIAGFTLDDCVEVLGDDLARVVRWADGPDVSRLAGIPVRLRFVLKDADLFSFRFSE